jgi:hypothetical protein
LRVNQAHWLSGLALVADVGEVYLRSAAAAANHHHLLLDRLACWLL